MKIAIIGAGGVGGYFGAKLAQAGFDVTFLARGEHLKTMLKHGLIVKSILCDIKIDNINATDKITEIEKPDLIIIAVKAWQIKEIRNDLKKIIHNESVIIPLQNGVLATEELNKVIDKKNILGGLCRIISKIESPGIINHFGVNPEIVIGELDKSKTTRIKEIQNIFEKAGINSKISKDIESDVWKKFIAICVSGLLAVTKTTYGELRENRQSRQTMIDLITEIYLISQKIGIKIEDGFVEKTVSFIDTFPYSSTSSLTRDVWEGRPSEIDYQNGTVINLGEKLGISTPINQYVYNCIKPMELKARGLITKSEKPIARLIKNGIYTR